MSWLQTLSAGGVNPAPTKPSKVAALQRYGFEVGSFGGAVFDRDQVLRDTADEFVGAFAYLVLLAGSGELERNFVALPMELERSEARENSGELLGGALGQDHHEFVGIETNGQVGAADDGGHSGAEFAQGLIASFAAEAVVDQSEIFEIEHDEREGVTHALRAGDFSGKALLGEAAIVEACERIEHRRIAQAVELRLLVGKLRAQLFDQKFLADGVDVEKNDQRDEREDGFGDANLEECFGALTGRHCGEGDDRPHKQQADENRIAAQRGVALLEQRQFLLKLGLAGIERGRDEIGGCGSHIESGAWPHLAKLELQK